MYDQTVMRIAGIILWILAIIILMASYGVLAKPMLETELARGFFEREPIYYNSSFVLSILLLTLGTFLIVYTFKK